METLVPTKTVLVVEDEALINMDIARALRECGFNVVQAFNGEQALAILRDHGDIRLVFTDVNLPGAVDGVLLAKEIERRWPQVEVLLTSAHRRPDVEKLEIVARLGRFVQKPYPLGAVTRRIHDIVDRAA